MPNKTNLTPLLHLLCTIQIVHDQIDNLPEDTRLAYFRRDLKKATNMYLNALKPAGIVLRKIWEHMPDEDFDEYIEVWHSLIRRMQDSTFEDLNEMSAILDDAKLKINRLHQLEIILNTHVPANIRDMYRDKLGYSLEQYKLMCTLYEKDKTTLV